MRTPFDEGDSAGYLGRLTKADNPYRKGLGLVPAEIIEAAAEWDRGFDAGVAYASDELHEKRVQFGRGLPRS